MILWQTVVVAVLLLKQDDDVTIYVGLGLWFLILLLLSTIIQRSRLYYYKHFTGWYYIYGEHGQVCDHGFVISNSLAKKFKVKNKPEPYSIVKENIHVTSVPLKHYILRRSDIRYGHPWFSKEFLEKCMK